MCRPFPTPDTTPTLRSASGTRTLTSVDFPTPECPISADTLPVTTSRSAAGSSSERVTTIGTSSPVYSPANAAPPSSTRSALVRHSTGVSPPA